MNMIFYKNRRTKRIRMLSPTTFTKDLIFVLFYVLLGEK